MELINNTTKTLRDDLSVEIKEGSKLSIAAACFSIYAFQELKKQLSDIDELRFIFTSPTFITEKAKKEKREFYIPRLNRERSLYGTEFEIKLRNELTQKAMLDKYNVITIYSQQLSNYSDFFEAHGIKKVESLITAWDTFSDETPGQAERCDYKGKSVYDLPEELKDRGMYLADTRAE